jgi:hypothetical protein
LRKVATPFACEDFADAAINPSLSLLVRRSLVVT